MERSGEKEMEIDLSLKLEHMEAAQDQSKMQTDDNQHHHHKAVDLQDKEYQQTSMAATGEVEVEDSTSLQRHSKAEEVATL